MFGSREKTKAKSNGLVSHGNPQEMMNSNNGTCFIAKGTVIDGTLKSVEDLRVDGTITGDVICQKRFVMGGSGMIKGKIECAESNIEGKIVGEIKVNGRLHLHNTALVEGKITAKKLIVDEGAAYNGECLIGEQHFKK